jgi:hypothetical protein
MTPTTANLVIAEIRRQVDHQLYAATATDTKAAGLIAGTFALTALIVPRVRLESAGIAGLITFGLIVGTLAVFAMAIRPRIGGFSYGPDAATMHAFVEEADEPDDLERAMVGAYVKVRDANERAIAAKSDALIVGVVGLILTVSGLIAMLATGGIIQ